MEPRGKPVGYIKIQVFSLKVEGLSHAIPLGNDNTATYNFKLKLFYGNYPMRCLLYVSAKEKVSGYDEKD